MVLSQVRAVATAAGIALVAAGCAAVKGPAAQPVTKPLAGTLPQFEHNTFPGPNSLAGTLEIEYLYRNNHDVFLAIPSLPAPLVIREMRARMRRTWAPINLRILAAGTLAAYGEADGQAFLMRLAMGKWPHAQNAIWMIGEVPRVRFWHDLKQSKTTDMRWAEDFMIGALKDRRVLWQEVPIELRGSSAKELRNYPADLKAELMEQSTIRMVKVAIDDGHFPERLAEMRSTKALPLIFQIIREGPTWMRDSVLGLAEYERPQVEAFVMEILRDREGTLYDYHPEAASVASKLGIKQAVAPLLLDLDHPGPLRHSDIWRIHEALLTLGDASIIPAIEAKLPELTGNKRDHARLTIVRLRGGDFVPGLLALLQEPLYGLRADVIRQLSRLKDHRAVTPLLEVMRSDRESYNCSYAIEALGQIGSREAIAGLIEGLGLDFSHLKQFKASRDYNPRMIREIGEALKTATGQDFGKDAERWKAWFTGQE